MSITNRIRREIRERDNYTCWRCGAIEDEDAAAFGDHGIPSRYFLFQVDHLIPRYHGGLDETWNLATACPRCNLGRQHTLEPEAVELADRQWLAGM